MALPVLPDVPLDLDPAVTAYLNELTDTMNQIIETFSPPALVTDITVEQTTLAIRISWVSAKNATQYRVLRSLDGSLTSAQIIATVPASKTGVATLSTQDVEDVDAENRYYWIQGINERGILGPVSQMVSISDAETGPYQETLNLRGDSPEVRWASADGATIYGVMEGNNGGNLTIVTPAASGREIRIGPNNNTASAHFKPNRDVRFGSVAGTSEDVGFIFIPALDGAPTGSPEEYSAGSLRWSAIVIDSTNNRLYAHSGGAWHFVALT